MLVLSRKSTIDTFGRSAMNDELNGIRARFSARFDTTILAALLAVVFCVPDGIPQLVSLSVLSLCSFASILRVCQLE